MFDLMFMLKWFSGQLPETLSEFSDFISSKFPIIFDTKFIAQSGTLKIFMKVFVVNVDFYFLKA